MINISDIQKAKDIINIKKLAIKCGIPYQNLIYKVNNNVELTVSESPKIEQTLKEYGLSVIGSEKSILAEVEK